MGIPRLATCCCGCSLETGTKIIAWLETIGFIAIVITASTTAHLLSDPTNYPNIEPSDINLLYGIFVTVAVICSIQLAISLLLIIGASIKKPSLMIPWLVFGIFNILLSIVMMIANSVAYSSAGMTSGIVSAVVSGLFGIFLKVYFYLVVYSYYREMRENPTTHMAI